MARTDPYFVITVEPIGSKPVRLEGKTSGLRAEATELGVRIVPADPTATILAFAYEETEGKADKLMLQVNNFDLRAFDEPLWRPGAIVRAVFGYPGALGREVACTVQKITGFRVLMVEAHGKGALMHKHRKVREFDNVRRSDVVRTIAREYGYRDEELFIDETPIVHSQLRQARMTDAQFMADMARREGKEFYTDAAGLHWHDKRLGQAPLRVFTHYNTGSDIIDISVKNDIYARKAGSVAAKGIDPLTGADIDTTAANANSTSTALASVKDLFTGISARDGTELPTQEREVGSSTVAQTTETTAAAATKAVAGTYAKNQLTAVELTMQIKGDPAIRAKTVVEVRNVSNALSGLYYVKSVKHVLDKGYMAALELKRDGRNRTDLQRGVATQAKVNDKQAGAEANPSAADTAKIGGAGGDELERIDRRDGTASFAERGGRGSPE